MKVRFLIAVLCLEAACVDLARPPGLDNLVDPNDAKKDAPVDAKPDPADLLTDAPDSPDGPDEDGATTDGEGDGGDDTAPIDTAPVDTAPVLLELGRPCDRGDQCASSFCAQGVCCNSACTDVCLSCSLTATPGMCTMVAAGEDPRENCAREMPATCGLDGTCDGAGACRRYPALAECAAGRCTAGVEYAASTCDGNGSCRPGAMRSCVSGMCTGTSCAAPCTSAPDCLPGFFCNAGKCALKRAQGAPCTTGDQCASTFCADGVCCNSECKETCFACNSLAAAGMCQPVAMGQDPRAQCVAQALGSCGRAGGCNGSGACTLQSTSVVCGGTTCSGTTETRARTCDGLGVCAPPAGTRDCAPYTCGATACGTTCSDPGGCSAGWTCLGTSCIRDPSLVLFWRMEEVSGTTVADGSGNGRDGTCVGSTGTPTVDTVVPTLAYPNTRSRKFTLAQRHAIQIATIPAGLKLTNDFTISVWFRATQVDRDSGDSTGSELVSAGNDYLLRLRASEIEFSKSTASNSPQQCRGNVTGHLNGAWHHAVGLTSKASGSKVYFDGVQVCSNNSTSDVTFNNGGPSFWVGRHGDSESQWDFGGNIDEVRIYSRVLTPAEIMALAQGRNN